MAQRYESVRRPSISLLCYLGQLKRSWKHLHVTTTGKSLVISESTVWRAPIPSLRVFFYPYTVLYDRIEAVNIRKEFISCSVLYEYRYILLKISREKSNEKNFSSGGLNSTVFSCALFRFTCSRKTCLYKIVREKYE